MAHVSQRAVQHAAVPEARLVQEAGRDVPRREVHGQLLGRRLGFSSSRACVNGGGGGVHGREKPEQEQHC